MHEVYLVPVCMQIVNICILVMCMCGKSSDVCVCVCTCACVRVCVCVHVDALLFLELTIISSTCNSGDHFMQTLAY